MIHHDPGAGHMDLDAHMKRPPAERMMLVRRIDDDVAACDAAKTQVEVCCFFPNACFHGG